MQSIERRSWDRCNDRVGEGFESVYTRENFTSLLSESYMLRGAHCRGIRHATTHPAADAQLMEWSHNAPPQGKPWNKEDITH